MKFPGDAWGVNEWKGLKTAVRVLKVPDKNCIGTGADEGQGLGRFCTGRESCNSVLF